MEPTKAQVIWISQQHIAVCPLEGPYKDKAYSLPLQAGVKRGQLVDIEISPAGGTAKWATSTR